MNVGINWVALVLMAGVLIVMRVRGLSLSARYLISGGLYLGVAASVVATGRSHTLNLVIAGLAAAFAINYLVKGFRARGGH